MADALLAITDENGETVLLPNDVVRDMLRDLEREGVPVRTMPALQAARMVLRRYRGLREGRWVA